MSVEAWNCADARGGSFAQLAGDCCCTGVACFNHAQLRRASARIVDPKASDWPSVRDPASLMVNLRLTRLDRRAEEHPF